MILSGSVNPTQGQGHGPGGGPPEAWAFPVMETCFHITLLWPPKTRKTRLVLAENIAYGD